MSAFRRASEWLDAVAIAVASTSLVFAVVGAVDARPEPWPAVLLAAVLYGLGGALTATTLTVLCGVVKRGPYRATAAAWSGTALAMSGLLGAYLAFWIEADVLAGSKWTDTYSIVALVAVGVAGLGLAAMAMQFTSRAPELDRRAIALFRLTALALVAGGAWFLSADARTGTLERRQPTGSAQPNIIVIVLDTLRADFTSIHGFPQPVTPSFERLAREGVQFLDAQSTASWTLPAVTSMLTSRLPGVAMMQGTVAGASQEPGLPEALAEMGYRTVVVSNNPYVFGPFGIAAHFDTVDAGRSEWLPPSTIVERFAKRFFTPSDGALVDSAIRWLERNDNDGPFFMYLHLMGGHSPYRAPKGYRSPIEVLPAAEAIDFPTHEFSISEAERESLRSRYAATIRYADDQVTRLLDAIDGWGLGESTLVVLTSDHGEEFGDHGGWGHGATLFREVLHVPMVWRWPGRLPAGTRRHDVISLVDVAPTLLAAIDPTSSSSRTGWIGTDVAVTREETLPAAGASVAEIAPALRSFTNPRWKYIRNETSQREWLFDRDRDPGETTDLLRERAETAKRLRQILLDATHPSAPGPTAPELEPVDPHVVQRLRVLGYLP